MTDAKTLVQHLAGLRRASLAAGGACGLALAIAALSDTASATRSYLVGLVVWLWISIGSLALLMIHNVTGGLWGRVTRRITEAAARTMPLLAILFLPVLAGARHVYEWTDSVLMTRDHHLHQKAAYLNLPSFAVRTALYFAVWSVLAATLSRWSRATEDGAGPGGQDAAERWSGPGLALLCVTVTFAGIDWLMSLEPRWVSAAYGLIFGISGILAAHAFQLVFVTRLPGAGALLSRGQLNDLGNLLLGFVMFWTYVTFSQFLIIWCGNLQEEVVYYLVRVRGGWSAVAWAVALGSFFLPFFLLLSPSNKRHLPTLSAIAALVLAARFVDAFWLAQPVFRTAPAVTAADALAPVAVGGIWLWWFIGVLTERPMDLSAAEEVQHG